MPGTGLTPAASAERREAILSPMVAMASGGGPTHTKPASITALAKAAFSAKNP